MLSLKELKVQTTNTVNRFLCVEATGPCCSLAFFFFFFNLAAPLSISPPVTIVAVQRMQ